MPGQSVRDLWWTERFSARYFSFPPSVSFHHCSILIFVYTLLLGQMDEICETSKRRCCFGNRESLDREDLLLNLNSHSVKMRYTMKALQNGCSSIAKWLFQHCDNVDTAVSRFQDFTAVNISHVV